MLIYCPKCQQGYNVDESLIPEKGRKLRCGSCGEVFWFDKSGMTVAVENKPQPEEIPEAQQSIETEESDVGQTDVVETEKAVVEAQEEVATDEPVDMNDIFKRLAEQTEGLFEQEKKLSLRERWWLKFKSLTGWNIRLKVKYLVVFAFFVVFVSLYNNRYDLSRKFPWTASVYGALGIESQVLGEGLEFQNINWAFFKEDETPVLQIDGFINNTTSRTLEIPVIHVEMLDENTGLLKSQNQKPEKTALRGKSRMPLKILVTKPSPTTKYVFLTFVKVDAED